MTKYGFQKNCFNVFNDKCEKHILSFSRPVFSENTRIRQSNKQLKILKKTKPSFFLSFEEFSVTFRRNTDEVGEHFQNCISRKVSLIFYWFLVFFAHTIILQKAALSKNGGVLLNTDACPINQAVSWVCFDLFVLLSSLIYPHPNPPSPVMQKGKK